MKSLLMIFLSFSIHAKPFKAPNCTYEHILKNSPRIDTVYARKLAKEIDRASKVHNLDPKLLSAIIMQESSYRSGMVAWDDYGLTMINIRNIRHFGFDKKKLLGHLVYSVNAGAEVLAEIKGRLGKKEKDWHLRYNCGSKPINHKICQDYKKRVER